VLLPDYRPLFPSFRRELGPGVSRSHLDSAVELGCPDRNSLARFIREGQLSEEFLYERDNGRIVEEFG